MPLINAIVKFHVDMVKIARSLQFIEKTAQPGVRRHIRRRWFAWRWEVLNWGETRVLESGWAWTREAADSVSRHWADVLAFQMARGVRR